MRNILLPLVTLLVLASVAGGEPLESRWLDVVSITAPVEDDAEARFGIRPFSDPNYSDGEISPFPVLEIDTLLEILTRALAAGAWEASGTHISSRPGNRILVRQRPDGLRRIEDRLATIAATLARPVHVEARWLTFGAPSSRRLREAGLLEALRRGRVGPDGVRRLLEEARRPGNTDDGGSAPTVRGRRVAIRRTRSTTYLRDYRVEVAQASRMSDPVLGRIREGLELYVRPVPLADGNRIALDVLARRGRLLRRRPVHTESREHGILDLPAFEEAVLSTASVLAPGETLALAIEGTGADGPALEALLVTARAPAARNDAVDAGFLVHHHASRRLMPELDDEVEVLERFSPWLRTRERAPRLDADRLREVLDRHGAVDAGGVEAGLLLAPPGSAPEIRRLVGDLEAAFVRPVRIDLRIVSLPVAALESARAGRLPEGSRDVRRVTLDALPGMWTSALSGTTHRVLIQYDVEVAKDGAQVTDPLPGPTFDGLAVNLRPHDGLSGDARALIDLSLRLERIEPDSLDRVRRTGADGLGVHQLPRRTALRWEGRVDLEPGVERVIDAGHVDPTDPTRRLAIVVSALPRRR